MGFIKNLLSSVGILIGGSIAIAVTLGLFIVAPFFGIISLVFVLVVLVLFAAYEALTGNTRRNDE